MKSIIFTRMKRLFVFYFLFISILGSAQDKKVQRIVKELNKLEINKAEQDILSLIDKNPNQDSYKEMHVMMLKQILDRIDYAKDELQNEFESDEEGNHLKIKTVTEVDSLGLEESDIAVEEEKVKKEENTDSLKSSRKKKKRVDPFEESTQVQVTIDPSLISSEEQKDDNFKNQLSYKEKETNSESTTVEASDLIGENSESSESSYINKLERKQAREDKKNEKIRAAQAEEEAKRLKQLQYFARMDRKYYEQRLIDYCLAYSLKTEYLDTLSEYIYQFTIDTVPQVPNDLMTDLLLQGKEAIQEGDIESGINYYKEAMDQFPNDEDVLLAMGQAYKQVKEDSLALQYFKAARRINENSLRVDEILFTYYFQSGDYQRALDHNILALMKYPKSTYFQNLRRIAERSAKDFKSNWVPRPLYPHSRIKRMQDLISDTKNPWYYYQMAGSEFKPFCDQNGVVKPNEKVLETYLETLCWMMMLDSCRDQSKFQFARAMRKIGMLDCYALITEFHHDLYPQYEHLVRTNPEKVLAYMSILCGWEKKRFEKLKLSVAPPAVPVIDGKKKKKK
jgi:hypothetical protein